MEKSLRYLLNIRYTFVWVSIKQELAYGVERAVVSRSANDFSDTNLGPDYLQWLYFYDHEEYGSGLVHHLYGLLWPCHISFTVVLEENCSNLHACLCLQRKKLQRACLLPCLISILNTSCCCSTDSQLALPLERQKSDHWFCIAENKEVSVPLLGVWHLMKWCFLRSLHWPCLPGRRKAASVCKPGGCNSCLAMLRSQLSS